MKKLEGIIIPAVTPFEEDGAVGYGMLKENYKKWNGTGVSGYMCLGSNGEFRSLSDGEAFQVIKTVSVVRAKDKALIAGVGRESLHQTLAFIERLHKDGTDIDYISILPPHYFKKLMTDDALADYYEAIADFSKYPVLLYCAPTYANGLCLSAPLVLRLADHPNIFGIKDTSPDMMDTYMDVVGGRDDFEVLAGSLGSILTCLKRGGKGGIVSAANYFPEECAKLVTIFQHEGINQAQSYHERLKALAAGTGGRAGVAGVKCSMNLRGYCGGVPRLPVPAVDEKTKAAIQEAILEGGSL